MNSSILQNNKCIALALCILLLHGLALHAEPFVYVANGSHPGGTPGPDTTVYVIDAATNYVVSVVDVGAHTCYNAVAVTPDNTTVLVGANNAGQGIVARIDVATNTHLLPDIMLSGSPRSIAILPNGLYAYVTCNDNTVNRINLKTNMVDHIISGFSGPFEITAAPNGLTVYVSNVGGQDVIPINVSDNSFGSSAPSGPEALWLTVSPDNQYLYITNALQLGHVGVQQYNLSNRLAPNPTTFISLGNSFFPGLALTFDGKTLYVTDSTNSLVIPIDLSDPLSPVVQPGVSLGYQFDVDPWIIAITPDGNSAYISDNATAAPGNVTQLDITNRLTPTIIATVDIGDFPAGLAITPRPPVLPPASVSGCKTRNVFLLQTDFINNITWVAPITGTIPSSYNIYRDAMLTELVANVPASGTLQFYDHDRQPNVVYSYYITSVDASGNQSAAASVTVTQSC